MCRISIRDSIVYPTWWGPPNTMRYTYTSKFSPLFGEKLNRIYWRSNNIDLQLDSVTINDAGLYTCQVTFNERLYIYVIEVNVRGKFKHLSKLNSDLFLCALNATMYIFDRHVKVVVHA